MLVVYLRPQWRKTLLMTLLLITSVGLQLLNPQLIRYFIDTYVSGGSLQALTYAAVAFIVIAIANQGVSVYATYISENVAWTATNHLRTDLVAHCLGLDMAFHKAHTAGELIERIDGDVNALSNFFSQFVVHLLSSALLLIGVLSHTGWPIARRAQTSTVSWVNSLQEPKISAAMARLATSCGASICSCAVGCR